MVRLCSVIVELTAASSEADPVGVLAAVAFQPTEPLLVPVSAGASSKLQV